MDKTNELFKGLVGVTSVTAGVAMTFMEQLLVWLRVAGVLLGVLVSMAMLWSIVATRIEKRRWAAAGLERERIKTERERRVLCHECRTGGEVPRACPVPKAERSTDCPLLRKAGVQTSAR